MKDDGVDMMFGVRKIMVMATMKVIPVGERLISRGFTLGLRRKVKKRVKIEDNGVWVVMKVIWSFVVVNVGWVLGQKR